MNYGKIIDGIFTPAPRRIEIGERQIFNPSEAQYIALGYLPVIYANAPEPPEGYYCVDTWEEENNEIKQIWHFEKLPPHNPEASELLNIILGGINE